MKITRLKVGNYNALNHYYVNISIWNFRPITLSDLLYLLFITPLDYWNLYINVYYLNRN